VAVTALRSVLSLSFTFLSSTTISPSSSVASWWRTRPATSGDRQIVNGRRGVLDLPHDVTMHGMARPRVLFAATLLLAGAAGGCARAPERVSDCVPPANEQTLLAEYESDPALAAAPAGAIPRGEPSRMAACYRVGPPGREGTSRPYGSSTT